MVLVMMLMIYSICVKILIANDFCMNCAV